MEDQIWNNDYTLNKENTLNDKSYVNNNRYGIVNFHSPPLTWLSFLDLSPQSFNQMSQFIFLYLKLICIVEGTIFFLYLTLPYNYSTWFYFVTQWHKPGWREINLKFSKSQKRFTEANLCMLKFCFRRMLEFYMRGIRR